MNAVASFKSASKPSSRSSLTLLPLSAVILCMLLNALQLPAAVQATDDVANLSPWELESIINQLVNPSPEYQLHASALRNQLKNILRNRQLAIGEEQSLNDYDYPEEDKRSVASLASRGLLRGAGKRGLATLAKNGQLPTQEPEDEEEDDLEAAARNAAKRYIGALARSGGLTSYGKRNIGTLARDFHLPQNGKRNVATLARLGLINSNREPKRNVASVARYNSNRMSATASSAPDAEKRNLGALKSSPVHGFLPQKRDDEESAIPADYVDLMPGYWLYPSYADLDWDTLHESEKRFLDTSKDPELFGINNALAASTSALESEPDSELDPEPGSEVDSESDSELDSAFTEPLYHQQKRHIGSIARSGFLPSYRPLHSTYDSGYRGGYGGYGGYGGGGYGGGRSGSGAGLRFNRYGRARQFVEYFPQRERLQKPIAAVCKRCFLPYRPVVAWGGGGVGGDTIAGVRGGFRGRPDMRSSMSMSNNLLPTNDRRPLALASTSPISTSSWGTPPRITALHRRSFRRPIAVDSYQY